MLVAACDTIFDFNVTGNGVTEVSSPSLTKEFSKIVLSSNFNVEIIQWSYDSISVEAETNLQPFIGVDVVKDVLTIGTNDNKTLMPQHQIRIEVYTKNIEFIENRSKGQIKIDTLSVKKLSVVQAGGAHFASYRCEADSFFYLSEGTSYADIVGDFKNSKIRQLGSGEVIIKGSSQNSQIAQEGSGKISAFGLKVKDADIHLYGTGLIYCSVDSFMNVKIIGDGKVFYRGDPQINSELHNANSLVKD